MPKIPVFSFFSSHCSDIRMRIGFQHEDRLSSGNCFFCLDKGHWWLSCLRRQRCCTKDLLDKSNYLCLLFQHDLDISSRFRQPSDATRGVSGLCLWKFYPQVAVAVELQASMVNLRVRREVVNLS